MIDDPNKPAWAGNFFTGIPAPAGAITVLLPIYLNLLGMPRKHRRWSGSSCLYTLAIALLMVSRLPVFSGKRVGKRVPPEMVLPIFVAGRAVLRAADQLSVARAQHRHAALSRLPAARLVFVPQLSSAKMPKLRPAASPARRLPMKRAARRDTQPPTSGRRA